MFSHRQTQTDFALDLTCSGVQNQSLLIRSIRVRRQLNLNGGTAGQAPYIDLYRALSHTAAMDLISEHPSNLLMLHAVSLSD